MENIYKRSGGYYTESGRFVGMFLDLINANNYQVATFTESDTALSNAKAAKKAEATTKKINDSQINITVTTGTFQANEYSKSKILAAATQAQRVGAGFSVDWLDENNLVVALSEAEIYELNDAIIDRDSSAVIACNLQKTEIEALTLYADVIAYIV